ncbi:MAG: hypothetical protein CVV47_12500 [Spirochaetae bacterium HGW-Spirochaetae-3]|jgi:CubicO group peptidase (beta-lactamase class C family)|nr:MAG: hypothetical protein CVV47_12500 [Spirochaetae bacterium HGW-Spirochaetae-3]
MVHCHQNRIRKSISVICIAVSFLQLAGCRGKTAQAGIPRSEEAREIDRIVRDYLVNGEQPGIAVAMVDGGVLSWQGRYGLADRDRKVPVTDRTLFEVGSLSKLLTCAAVLRLAERGLVDIDRPFVEYVPDFSIGSPFPTGVEAITVRMLLTHRSGLMADDDAWETTRPERYLYRALLPYLLDKSLQSQPGRVMRYSSFGYHLLGLLVERVSGVEYAAYMRDNLLGPLGMDEASFDYASVNPDLLARAYGYNAAWDKIPMDEIRPAGSLRTSVGELTRFALMILNGGSIDGRVVLEPESVAEMMVIQSVDDMDAPGDRMTLGFFVETVRSATEGGEDSVILYHFGSGRHRSMLALAPKSKKGVILCANDWSVARSKPDLFSRVRTVFTEHASR